MVKVVTIHQPNYLPWIGFFSKVKASDYLVLLDNVEYTKNSPLNRNKIRIRKGWCYLTIPIEKKYHSSKICDVRLPTDNRWQKSHWTTIDLNYKKAEYFDSYKKFFEELYKKNFGFLCEINEEIIEYLLDCFKIDVDVVRASKLHINPDLRKTDLLIELLKKTDASTYLSGSSGRTYLDESKFKDNRIELKFFDFRHPVYKQRYLGFEESMAAIDLLFNMGEESYKLL